MLTPEEDRCGICGVPPGAPHIASYHGPGAVDRAWAYGPKEKQMKEYLKTLVLEGSRVLWTAVEAAGGFLAAYNVPLPDLGQYTGPVRGLVGIAVASLATWIKELARKHLESR